MKQSQLMHGETLEYWKENAEEDYIKVPISVLKYITILEEQSNQRVIEELEDVSTVNPKHIHNFVVNRIQELKQER
jgi:hypothetical protein